MAPGLAEIPLPPAGYVGLFSAVADAQHDRPGQEVTLSDGRQSLEFVSAVYASARSKRPVELPLIPDRPSYAGWGPT